MGLKKYLFSAALLVFCSCMGQDRREVKERQVGGPCEGCEALYEYGDRLLTPVDTLPGFEEQGARLQLSGTIFRSDGRTPAGDVILYIYHTNSEGIYPTRGDETGWGRRHGYLRGWIKTGADGSYSFYTTRPGSYPSGDTPAHIHVLVKEPDTKVYYLDDYEFKGNPFVKQRAQPRGGSGLIDPEQQGDLLVARRDIILGLNIPDYR